MIFLVNLRVREDPSLPKSHFSLETDEKLIFLAIFLPQSSLTITFRKIMVPAKIEDPP